MTERVLFRKWKTGPAGVIAYLLDQPEGQGQCVSYMHVGQHGSAVYPNADTAPARAEEYAPLLKELCNRGYKLRVVQRGRIKEIIT